MQQPGQDEREKLNYWVRACTLLLTVLTPWLRNWHRLPLWPATNDNMRVVFDAPLHAVLLRFVVGMYWAKLGIVLPQLLDKLSDERVRHNVDLTVDGAAAWSLDLPDGFQKCVSCVQDVASPAVDIAENGFVQTQPGQPKAYKLRQPSGHSAMQSVKHNKNKNMLGRMANTNVFTVCS